MTFDKGLYRYNASDLCLGLANRATRHTWIKAGIISETTDELWCCAGFTLSTELAAKANEAKAKKTFEQMVPKEYHKYSKVFSEVDSHRFPQHRPWDHAIDLKPDADVETRLNTTLRSTKKIRQRGGRQPVALTYQQALYAEN
jgi:hypothetical protein